MSTFVAVALAFARRRLDRGLIVLVTSAHGVRRNVMAAASSCARA